MDEIVVLNNALTRWTVLLLVAPLAHPAWGANAPGVEQIQQAYEEARSDPQSNAQHVYDLDITNARCVPLHTKSQQMCQIDFIRRGESPRRLYFEVVTIEERQSGWLLLSGLCKTKSTLASSNRPNSARRIDAVSP